MFSGFELDWPWIGLGAAVVLLALLFGTNALRSRPAISRWRDPAWLGWLGMVVYLIHNVEEYGIASDGVRNAFPDSLCGILGLGAYPGCAIPTDFYLYVNLTIFWVVAPACALLARRRAAFGFVIYGVIAVNLLVHVGGSIATWAYGPGLVTALVLFLPASVWAGIVLVRDERLGWGRLAAVLALGIAVHAVLMGSVLLFVHGAIPAVVLNGLQVANGALVLAVGALLQRGLPAATIAARGRGG